MVCSCATAPKTEKADKTIVEKSDQNKIEESELKAIRKMAKEIAKDRGMDFYLKGMTEFSEGDFQDSIVILKKAVEENPRDYQAYYALGRSYEKVDKFNEAEAAYEETVKLKSEYLPAREALGLLCFHRMKFKEAKTHLKEAGTLGSRMAEVYYGLGEIDQRENACSTAINNYREALKLNPEYLAARNGLKVTEEDCRQKPLHQQK